MELKSSITNQFLGLEFSAVRFLQNPDNNGSIVIGAFPYTVQDDYSDDGVRISPFAQNNHYGEAVKRLKQVSQYLRNILPITKKEIRIFCNSQFKEKWFAASSGLGFYGRNSLIITKEAGSRVILAGIMVPIDFPPDNNLKNGTIPGALCGSCRNCIKSCPTGAIEKGGIINRNLCLQSLTTDTRILPDSIMEKWGNRLYGCSICQDCCPFNKNRPVFPTDEVRKGKPGDSVPYKFILTADDSTLKEYFRGTALSMSWISYDMLRRNAIISAASENRKDLQELIKNYFDHSTIGYAANWSFKKITRQPTKAPIISAEKSLNSIILP